MFAKGEACFDAREGFSVSVRHVILVLLSLAGGVGAVLALMVVLNTFYNANVNVQEFGYGYAVLTGLPIAVAVGVWLDYFLGTGVLPD